MDNYVSMKFHPWFEKKKKSTILMGDIENRGGFACVMAESVWERLYFPFNYIVNLNLL